MDARLLKCLESWNRERWERHRREKALIAARKTGFGCPRCKAELWVKEPGLIFGGVGDLKDDPLTRDVYCPSCMFIGVQLV